MMMMVVHEGCGVKERIETRSAEFDIYNQVHKVCCCTFTPCVRLCVDKTCY